jgi:hypothetical protein
MVLGEKLVEPEQFLEPVRQFGLFGQSGKVRNYLEELSFFS